MGYQKGHSIFWCQWRADMKTILESITEQKKLLSQAISLKDVIISNHVCYLSCSALAHSRIYEWFLGILFSSRWAHPELHFSTSFIHNEAQFYLMKRTCRPSSNSVSPQTCSSILFPFYPYFKTSYFTLPIMKLEA